MDNKHDIPERLTPPVAFEKADDIISLWEGEAELDQNTTKTTGRAKVFLDTLPKPAVWFEFRSNEKTENQTPHDMFNELRDPKSNSSLNIGELKCDYPLNKIEIQPIRSYSTLSGLAYSKIHELSDQYVYARYLIINGPVSIGDGIRANDMCYTGRETVKLANSAEITIDCMSHEPFSKRDVYQFTHVAKIQFNDLEHYSEFEKIENVLVDTLSLIKGRRVGLVGPWLYDDEKLSCISPSVTSTTRNGSNFTWFTDMKPGICQQLLILMYQASLDEEKEEVLKTAIHWLVESQLCSGGIEGSIILTQAALEALAWYEVVTSRKEMSRNKFDKKCDAHQKFTKLLSYYDIDYQIPLHESELLEYANDFEKQDLVEVMVSMRNALVHAEPKKTKRLFQREEGVPERTAVWLLSIGLLEQAVLAVLGYNGPIVRRDLDCRFKHEATKWVPWGKPDSSH